MSNPADIIFFISKRRIETKPARFTGVGGGLTALGSKRPEALTRMLKTADAPTSLEGLCRVCGTLGRVALAETRQ